MSQQVLHIAGWSTCGFYKRAVNVVSSLTLLFPSRIKLVHHEFPSRDEYREWLIEKGFRDEMKDPRAHKHTSSPFTWLSSDVTSYVGGCDDTLEWCRKFCTPSSEEAETAIMVDDGYTKDHGYDYDLVVIGGGSGGLAASKEAASFGARVAVLDFVKPSTQGTTWGLGGTCVNVGCIPKKLMHTAALINESVKVDTKPFGITTEETNGDSMQHSWETMRENVQNHICGLNFKYRVDLRENKVSYLNKLGRFVDAHNLEVTDKKGKKSMISAARFLIAVGGRPAGLEYCPGGELAISSDDIFSLEKSPGKTLCVGASYISLECAGFLAGLGYDTTVAVRSILLRGFDRECVETIGQYMENHGVKFRYAVTPEKLEKMENGRIKVTFSDDSFEEFDTVLSAIGRNADTEKLGLENVNIVTNPKNKKIATKYEQTSCPNIYAIGDVMEGCPELTPVAIQAGKSLSRRLFNGSNKPMDYKSICTTVFTPIEYGCVGYSEEEASETFGKDSLEVYIRKFIPLEWSLTESRSHHEAFTKVICNKKDSMKILGIHFVGPNAGEVMQGYATAFKKGMTFQDLEDTVGIHPTSAEEIVTLTVTKSSGKSASAGGC